MPKHYHLEGSVKCLKDSHGQPRQLFKFNFENNVSKAIDQLSGICAGILADGIVCEKEALFFKEWVEKYAQYEPVYPFTEILKRVQRIFHDGHIDDAEKEELADIMRQITGRGLYSDPSQDYSSELPLDGFFDLMNYSFKTVQFQQTRRRGFDRFQNPQ